MIEGYDHDDIYIMVEDEFHSVAQTFTQHLHHAEYQRLKKKARDAAPPTFQPTERMRAETRKKLEARALYAKQKDAVGDITNGVNLLEDEEQEDDPWLGTSLSGLMTDVSCHKRTALVGLEKIQSSTRAAKGFARGTGNSPPDRREKMSVFDIFSAPKKGADDALHEQEHEINMNHLDHPFPKEKGTVARPIPRQTFSRETGISRKATSNPTANLTSISMPPSSARTNTYSSSHPRFREPSMATRKLFDEFDHFEALDKASNLPGKAKASPSRRDSQSKQTKTRKMEMSDIPTFLV
jgi:hypothetical protein